MTQTLLLLQEVARTQPTPWEHSERSTYDLASMRREFTQRLYKVPPPGPTL